MGGCGFNVLKNFTTFFFLKQVEVENDRCPKKAQRMSPKTAFKDSLEKKMYAKTGEEGGCKEAPKGRNISPAAAASCDHN